MKQRYGDVCEVYVEGRVRERADLSLYRVLEYPPLSRTEGSATRTLPERPRKAARHSDVAPLQAPTPAPARFSRQPLGARPDARVSVLQWVHRQVRARTPCRPPAAHSLLTVHHGQHHHTCSGDDDSAPCVQRGAQRGRHPPQLAPPPLVVRHVRRALAVFPLCARFPPQEDLPNSPALYPCRPHPRRRTGRRWPDAHRPRLPCYQLRTPAGPSPEEDCDPC